MVDLCVAKVKLCSRIDAHQETEPNVPTGVACPHEIDLLAELKNCFGAYFAFRCVAEGVQASAMHGDVLFHGLLLSFCSFWIGPGAPGLRYYTMTRERPERNRPLPRHARWWCRSWVLAHPRGE